MRNLLTQKFGTKSCGVHKSLNYSVLQTIKDIDNFLSRKKRNDGLLSLGFLFRINHSVTLHYCESAFHVIFGER